MRIRPAVPGDGEAIARIHRDNSAYYVGLAPELFRLPDEDGLIEFVDPTPDDNSDAKLFIVAEGDEDIVGYLYAELITPEDSDRFQSPAEMNEVRLFVHALSVMQSHWRQGIATTLTEEAEAWGRERGAKVVLCDTWPDSPVSLPFWRERMHYEPRSVRLRKRLSD